MQRETTQNELAETNTAETNTDQLAETKPGYHWKIVAAAFAVPPITALLMHIPVYLQHQAITLTVLGTVLTAIGGLTTLGITAPLLLDEGKPSFKGQAALAAAALTTTAGILLICRGQL